MNQKPSNGKDRYALLFSYYSLAMQLNSKLLLVRINPPLRKSTNYISKSNLSLTIFAISTHSNSRVRFSLDVSSVGDNPSECTVMNFINIFEVFIEDFDERIKQIMQQKEKERKVYLYSQSSHLQIQERKKRTNKAKTLKRTASKTKEKSIDSKSTKTSYNNIPVKNASMSINDIIQSNRSVDLFTQYQEIQQKNNDKNVFSLLKVSINLQIYSEIRSLHQSVQLPSSSVEKKNENDRQSIERMIQNRLSKQPQDNEDDNFEIECELPDLHLSKPVLSIKRKNSKRKSCFVSQHHAQISQ